MSTHCNIAMVTDIGHIRYIYCHFDGYHDGVGATLNKHFTSIKDVRMLIDMGDISSVQENKQGQVEIKPYSTRGEAWNDIKPREVGTLTEFQFEPLEDYVYLYKDGAWEFR